MDSVARTLTLAASFFVVGCVSSQAHQVGGGPVDVRLLGVVPEAPDPSSFGAPRPVAIESMDHTEFVRAPELDAEIAHPELLSDPRIWREIRLSVHAYTARFAGLEAKAWRSMGDGSHDVIAVEFSEGRGAVIAEGVFRLDGQRYMASGPFTVRHVRTGAGCIFPMVDGLVHGVLACTRERDAPAVVCEATTGLLHGECRHYSTGGELVRVRPYASGALHGISSQWNEGGQLAHVASYERGVPVGCSRRFHESDGQPHITVCHTASGRLRSLVHHEQSDPTVATYQAELDPATEEIVWSRGSRPKGERALAH